MPAGFEPLAQHLGQKAELGIVELEPELRCDDPAEPLDVSGIEKTVMRRALPPPCSRRDRPGRSDGAQDEQQLGIERADRGETRRRRRVRMSGGSSSSADRSTSSGRRAPPRPRGRRGARRPSASRSASASTACRSTAARHRRPARPSRGRSERPSTKSGAPATGSIGSGRVVSMTFSRGSAQSRVSTRQSSDRPLSLFIGAPRLPCRPAPTPSRTRLKQPPEQPSHSQLAVATPVLAPNTLRFDFRK